MTRRDTTENENDFWGTYPPSPPVCDAIFKGDNMGQLDGKIALITGGGTGIGKGIGRAFAKEGANLVLASRTKENLEAAADELRSLGASVLIVPTDVTVEAQVIALFEQAVAEFGRVDILVNNSGIGGGAPLDEMSLESWNSPGNTEVERRAASTRTQDQEPMMSVDDLAIAALAMAALPPYANMLEAIVLPVEQL